MRLLACFCFLVLLLGIVIGRWVGAVDAEQIGAVGGCLHRSAVVGDQRTGSLKSFPGVMGNSNLSDAGIV